MAGPKFISLFLIMAYTERLGPQKGVPFRASGSKKDRGFISLGKYDKVERSAILIVRGL